MPLRPGTSSLISWTTRIFSESRVCFSKVCCIQKDWQTSSFRKVSESPTVLQKDAYWQIKSIVCYSRSGRFTTRRTLIITTSTLSTSCRRPTPSLSPPGLLHRMSISGGWARRRQSGEDQPNPTSRLSARGRGERDRCLDRKTFWRSSLPPWGTMSAIRV